MLERVGTFWLGRTGRANFLLAEAGLATGYFLLGAVLGPIGALVLLLPFLASALAIAALSFRRGGAPPRSLLRKAGEGACFLFLLVAALTASPDSSLSSDFGRFRTFTMPVLLIWGDTDSVTPLWQGEDLRGLIPGSTLEIVHGAGHIPHLEDPAAFQRALGPFLRTVLR